MEAVRRDGGFSVTNVVSQQDKGASLGVIKKVFKYVEISSVISNPASKIIQTDTSSVILRKHPRFSTIQKVGT